MENNNLVSVLKVSARTKPASLAGAIAQCIRKDEQVELHAVGAAAVNQAVKGIVIARGYVAPEGVDLSCIPGFCDVFIEGGEKSCVKLIIKTV